MLNTDSHNYCTSRKACFCIFIFILTIVLTPIVLMADSSNVPKTGQTISYQSKDDGDLKKGVIWPSPRFSDNGDGTVTDILTNLVWLKEANCFHGTWEGALEKALALKHDDCSLSDGSVTEDWRVPNVRELESLLHLGVHSPAIPNTIGSGGATYQSPFTSLQADDYWTSTSNTATPSYALIVNVQYGHIKSATKGSGYWSLFLRDSTSGTPVSQAYATGQTLCYDSAGVPLVSCEGTGQDGDLQKGMVVAPPRFTDNGNGTVFDNLTGLTWLKNANCLGITSWSSALSLTNLLANGTCELSDDSVGGDWRIPNSRELLSLIDYGYHSPALTDGAPFIGVQPTSAYWSSTTYSGFTGNAWLVYFNIGISGSTGKHNVAYTWPVRNFLASTLSVSIEGEGTGKVTSTPAGISCPGECSNEFGRFSSVFLTAQADSGSRFDGWSIASCGRNPTCHVYMSATQSVLATFLKAPTAVSAWEILLLKD